MRVKKFEAKSMKEALQLVKNELGPEAVILSAKDNTKRFGIAGDGSVEVTAAVSEVTYRKKAYTESRLPKETKDKWQELPASRQKQVIDKMLYQRNARMEQQSARSEASVARAEAAGAKSGSNASGTSGVARPRPITPVSYVDIPDEMPQVELGGGRKVNSNVSMHAAAAASEILKFDQIESAKRQPELAVLRKEIERLQGVIQQFQKVPQNFSARIPGADLDSLYRKLQEAGIAEDQITEVLTEAEKAFADTQLRRAPLVEAYVAKWFLQNVRVSENPDQGRVHVFVGPSASGKSSMIIKYASHLILNKKKKVALVTTDTGKVGAVDQLKIYCQILNIPLAVVRGADDWEPVFDSLANYDHVLIDTPGVSLAEMSEIDRLKSLLPPASVHPKVHLVLNCKLKDVDATEIARRFQMTQYRSLIFTGLDQSVQHGSVFNLQRRLQVPLHSFSVGSRMPEDFEYASKERVLDLIFKITKFPKEVR